MTEDDSEKPFEATPKKLEEARKRGEAPISQELVTFSVYAAILALTLTLGTWSAREIATALYAYLDRPEHMLRFVFEDGGRHLHTAVLVQIILGLSMWFILPMIFALSIAFLQGALVFSGQKLHPKLNRISLVKNAKQKYGVEGVFNFFKSFLKLLVYCLILVIVFHSKMESIISMSALPVIQALTLISEICIIFLFLSTLAMMIISGMDYFWQHAQFLRKQRMSLRELKDELKETEGDPFTKQTRRQMAQDIATNQMLLDVPDADVVIVNPEHYAVALKWNRKKGNAPVCVAKGVDEVARRIRETATEHAVPVYRDPPTARTVFATVEIGEEVAVELYQAIAAAIRFADAMRKKARGNFDA